MPLLGPGVEFELNTCVEKAKIHQTVVIIPQAESPFRALDDEPPAKMFPRVIHHDEVPDLDAVSHFVFRDLVDRARAIASLEPSERRALVDTGQLAARFPVTFEGLCDGYKRLAADYETSGQRPKATRSYFGRWWWQRLAKMMARSRVFLRRSRD